jgi:cytochrome c peroxidase
VLAVVLSCALLLPGGLVWAANPGPLSAVPVPTPPNLGDFVKDKAAAIKLGKALFWDMNVGGDGVQACASCHYRAGADPINTGPGAPGYPNAVNLRATNQLNPGANGALNVLTGPNLALTPAMFPFFQVANPLTAKLEAGFGAPTRNLDDVVGSQGTSFNLFNAIVFGSALDNGTPQLDPTYGHSRRVTGRNTPPAVNAIFNYANFWDGRANNIFNGSSPLGPLDPTAGIWVNLNAHLDEPILQFQKIAIPNASLASQAVGPPNNAVEMSWDGRNFPKLARKLLNSGLTPLGQQHVSPNDSALGALANAGTGLSTSYNQMIQNAFYEKYWDSFAPNINISGTGYSQMEANFSLFWGLSIMLYEATLISDQTPFDMGTMTVQQQNGATIFTGKGGCNKCHSGPEFTDASVSAALANGLILQGETNVNGAISDMGFHNLGVRPTAEDVGRGGIGGSPNPIASFAGEAIAQANGTLPFTAPQAISGGITANTPVSVNGTFKTPQLRNVGLTAPYMHNGSMLTLEQVVEFYSRHGNFNNAELAKDMSGPFGGGALDPTDVADLVEFLKNGLTDPRVAAESAPFDHPVLPIPDGTSATLNDNGTDPKIILAVTGGDANGNPVDIITPFLARATETMTLAGLPKATLTGAPVGVTSQTAVTVSVGGDNVAAYMYKLDNNAYSAATPTTTSISLTGLADGAHTLSVIGVGAAGHQQAAVKPTTASFTVNTTAPVLTINTPATMTKNSTQTISGTVEPGVTPVVSVNTGASVGPVTVNGTTWTCTVSGLAKGDNTITVTATNAAGNTASKNCGVKILIADGCFRGTGSPDVTDALKALRMAVGLVTPTVDDYMHGDVNADSKIDSGDALLILRKATGLTSF